MNPTEEPHLDESDPFVGVQPVQAGDVLTVEVERLGDDGDGLCRVQNYVIWVPGALPGETVEIEIRSAGRKNARARLVRVEVPSEHRVAPRCRHFGECGGCQLQHLAYAQQLEFKTRKLEEQLRHALGVEAVPVSPCVGPEDPWHGRARIALQFTERQGQLRGGLFRRRSRELIEIEECPVSVPEGLAVARQAVEAARGIGAEAWDHRTDGGTLRAALVRTNSAGRSELTLVTRRRDGAELRALREADFGAEAVYLNQNDGDRERLLGWQTSHFAGSREFHTEVAGRKLVLSPAAWLRTSTFTLETIAGLVRELLEPIPGAVVADLYSGGGTLALAIAGDVAKVFAIEEHPRAVQDAIASIRANGIDNVLVREGKVEQHLADLKTQKLYAAILDPPPEGCGRYVVNVLAKVVRPERLIYVSQNPDSFAAEAAMFEDRGYRLTTVRPVDSAPHTGSVELVARFESSMQGGKRRSTIAQARRLLDKVRRAERQP